MFEFVSPGRDPEASRTVRPGAIPRTAGRTRRRGRRGRRRKQFAARRSFQRTLVPTTDGRRYTPHTAARRRRSAAGDPTSTVDIEEYVPVVAHGAPLDARSNPCTVTARPTRHRTAARRRRSAGRRSCFGGRDQIISPDRRVAEIRDKPRSQYFYG